MTRFRPVDLFAALTVLVVVVLAVALWRSGIALDVWQWLIALFGGGTR